MNVVIDASIALDLFTTPSQSPAQLRAIALFTAIADGTLIASVPDHFSIEVANAALKYQRRYSTLVKPRQAIEFLGHWRRSRLTMSATFSARCALGNGLPQ